MIVRSIPRSLLAVVFVLIGVYSLVGTPHARAQTASTTAPTIVASGIGQASGAADSASLQVIVVSQAAMYGMMGDAGMASDTVEICTNPPCGEEGTPVAGGYEPVGGATPSMGADVEASLPAVIDAIAAAGVARDQIEVITPAFTSSFAGPGGIGGSQLRFTVDHPTADGLQQLVNAVENAATGAGLSVQHIGATYTASDCDGLQQQARTAAVADARKRAEGLAQALSVTLGDLVQAADNIFYGPYGDGSGGCGDQSATVFAGYGEGIMPPFDADSAAEVTVYSQITLTYEIATK